MLGAQTIILSKNIHKVTKTDYVLFEFLCILVLYITRNVVFRDGDNFCKAFPEAQVHISHITSGEATSDMTYARVPLRKLCKNCPHPEKPFPYSKPISHIIYSYQLQLGINKIFLLKNQNQNILKILSNDRVVMLKNPLQITCDMQKKILILKKLVKSQSGHTEKPFAGHM